MKTVPIVSVHPRMYRLRLTVARLAAMGLATLTLTAFLPLLPAYLGFLHTVCVGAACPVGQLTPQAVQALGAVGLSVDIFVASTLVLTLLALLMCWSVAAVIVWRKSDEWMALLVAVMLMLMGTSYVTHLLLQRPSPWQVPALLLDLLTFGVFFLVFCLFPSGRFVPSWLCLLPMGWIAWGVVTICLHQVPGFYSLHLVGFLGGLIAIVSAQVYRYRRVSTVGERQQTKWVVWGASIAMLGVVGISLPEALVPALVGQSGLYRLLDAPALTLALFLGAFSIGMAILRARLWDIDVLINRTLVYSGLSASLAALYVGLILALQALVHAMTGQASENSLVIVASTLALVALFNPLQRRIQLMIDRRFYRRAYDAAQTLVAFGARLQQRDEVDLATLSADLQAVVRQTMQPTRVSLWLRPPAPGTEIAHLPAVRAASGGQVDSSPLVLAPDDPLVAALLSAAGAVETAQLHLDSPALRALQAAGMQLAVPLISQGELVGLLQLGPRKRDQGYSSDDRGLLNRLAIRAAPAIRVAQLVREQQAQARERERLEEELRIARQIQQAFLPQDLPTLPGWQLAAYYQPAHEVGGDFYDFLTFADGRLGIVMGDVSGKGIPAALLMTTTRTILRSVAQREASPGQVLEQTNTLLYPEMPPGMFVTCFYAILDPATGRLRYANAGHDQPYQRQKDRVSELWARGMPLGLLAGMTYEEQESSVSEGDTVLWYSDGLVEAHNPERAMFGFPRLAQLLQEQRTDPSLIDFLLQQLAIFTGPDWEQEDDVTLVTLHRSSGYGRSAIAARSATKAEETMQPANVSLWLRPRSWEGKQTPRLLPRIDETPITETEPKHTTA